MVRPYGIATIAEAAELIRRGLPVAIPTETVYGLAADATDGEAVARIYAAKGRPAFNPLIVHVPDRAAAETIGEFDLTARALAERFWPGPLTIVVSRRADCGIAALATAGLDTIAIRVPAHRAMQALLAASGRPLAAPSANASGRISPTRAEHVLTSLKGRIPLIVDDGATTAGIESTIVAAIQGTWRILREGPVTREMLADIIAVADFVPSNTITAPGQLDSHYAPAKPLRINARIREDGEWLIGFGAQAGDANLSASGDPIEAASTLFDRLHEADASAALRIAVAPIPHEGIGAAINDRLRRAAH